MQMPADASLDSADRAGLRWAGDERAGIRRLRSGKGFSYRDADGARVADPASLRRIRRLAIPPAWTDVWICADPRGHLQATGRDARGRKQYRYHERWREIRDADKYGRLAAFGRALPLLRRRVRADLAKRGLDREKVLACAVLLLETSLIRIGNDEYTRANRSFGLTTLRGRHVRVSGSTVRFRFRGKSGRDHDVDLVDERIARVVRRLQDLPGQELFQYLDPDGNVQPVDSGDVNEYVRAAAGEDFTAKDFRTWAGTVLMTRALADQPKHAPGTGGTKASIARACAIVAVRLGNTAAVCRKSYIHPAVVEAYESGALPRLMRNAARRKRPRGLFPDEAAVLTILGQAAAATPKAA